ncbi:fibronectin type III domain-containing protein [Kribbella deserti]|uniref:Fibronectin type III domain-containing protein n=1 Tax=Kribbella deserti TaxID=1926257 RepID=A0ABV6QIL5_9ACTN
MRKLSLFAVGLLLAGTIHNPAAQATGTPIVANASSAWQTNAPVQALHVTKGKVYVGGKFTKVRPPGAAAGTKETARSYLAVFNATTGALEPINLTLNGQIWSITSTPTGSRVFIGGDFTTVNGETHHRIAAIDTATMKLISSFRTSVDWRVKAMASYGSVLYIGGAFNNVTVGATKYPRKRLAGLNNATGGVLAWVPKTDDADVHAIDVADNGSRVLVGGDFKTVNGTSRYGLASLAPYPNTGVLQPFKASGAMPQPTPGCVSRVKDIETYGDRVYVAAAGDGAGCFDGTFAAKVSGLGDLVWKNYCLGATEAITYVKGWLYKGSHAHDCSKNGDFPEGPWGNKFLLVQSITTGRIGPWVPNTNATGDTQVGPLAMATGGADLWVGGDFTTVNGKGQQGLTRFTGLGNGVAPVKPVKPSVTTPTTRRVDVSLPATTDLDDTVLTYRLLRWSMGQLVTSKTVVSTFWWKPKVTLSDTSLAPGAKVQYRVEVTDGKNTVRSDYSAVVTVK